MILSGHEEGRNTLVEAAERMGVSYRQTKGIWYRYHKENDAGLIDKSRGKPSTRAFDQNVKKIILKLHEIVSLSV